MGHKGSTKVLGRMLGPMQTECGVPWAPSTAGWLLLCVVMCAFRRIPSDTEPGAFGHLFIWVYLEGCSCSPREVNALPSSPQVTLAVHMSMRINSTSMHKSGHTERTWRRSLLPNQPRLWSRHCTEAAQHSEVLRGVFSRALASLCL